MPTRAEVDTARGVTEGGGRPG